MVYAMGQSRLVHVGKRVALVGLGLMVGLVVAELGFRWRDKGSFPHVNFYQTDPKLGVRLEPGAEEKLSLGKNPVTSARINKQGYRGVDWPEPGANDVLVIGDSQVFGLGVEENETFSSKMASELGSDTHVLNAGVPTYGPLEYNLLLQEILDKRKVKTVVYTVNYVNDPFEAQRPNSQRHVVWDGWAVRKETAPAKVNNFPGRQFLYRKSHLVYAFRQWFYKQGPQRDDRGFASEGTWRDLIDLGTNVQAKNQWAEQETLRLGKEKEVQMRYAARAARASELRVKLVAYKELKLQSNENEVYLASDANPGDIVVPQQWEESRPLSASVQYVREAAVMRKKFEARLKELAAKDPNSPTAKTIVSSLEERDKLERYLVETLASPVEIVRTANPLLRMVEQAKAMTEKHGARFVLVVLPIDVQVSEEEWKKYNAKPMDMKGTHVLVQDLVEGTQALGASALDATSALKAAEPGAFVFGDPHMSPKGHAALAKALVSLLKSPPPKPKKLPRVALPQGRSRMPRPEEWSKYRELLVPGSGAANCTTKRIREWYFFHCTAPKKTDPVPTGAVIEQGGHGEGLIATYEDTLTVLFPMVPGDDVKVRFLWDNHAKIFESHWAKGDPEPDLGFSKADKSGGKAKTPTSPEAEKLCACYKKQEKKDSCIQLYAVADKDCVQSYGSSCEAMLECATGFAPRKPTCAPGFINMGARLACFELCGKGDKCTQGTCLEKQGEKVCMPVPKPGVEGPIVKKAPLVIRDMPKKPTGLEVTEFDKRAWQAIQRIHRTLEDCQLIESAGDVGAEWEIFETCEWKEKEMTAMLSAIHENLVWVKQHPDLAQGERASIVKQFQLFSDWMKFSQRAKQTRGTLALFQGLAITWNSYQPKQKTAPDPPTIVAHYFGQVHNVVREAWAQKKVEARRKRGLPLPWEAAVHGPRLRN
jgi:hypothetical protein